MLQFFGYCVLFVLAFYFVMAVGQIVIAAAFWAIVGAIAGIVWLFKKIFMLGGE